MLCLRLSILLFFMAVAGCSGGPKIVPVSGKIVYMDGTLATNLAGYTVEFESIDGKIDSKRVSANGTVTKEGTFMLTTLKEGDGALVGKHRVLISPPGADGDTPSKPHVIMPKYVSYETSGLTAEVGSTSRATVTLTIEKRAK